MDRRGLLVLGVAVGLGACAGELAPLENDDATAGGQPDAASRPDAREADAGSTTRDDAATAMNDDAATVQSDDAATAQNDAGPDAPPPLGFVLIGTLAEFALNTWANKGAGGRAWIVAHDPAGIFIYSAICTHSGCVVPAPCGPRTSSVCPCHLSTFDDQGAKLSGPARGPLTHRAAFISGGMVYVHTMMTVPATDRTPLP